jgi:hypothetical protein
MPYFIAKMGNQDLAAKDVIIRENKAKYLAKLAEKDKVIRDNKVKYTKKLDDQAAEIARLTKQMKGL